MSALPPEQELPRLLERFEAQPEGRLFAPLADCYRRLGRLDEASKVCVDGLSRHPRYSTGYVILARIHLDRQERDEARRAFETVLALDPENLVALRFLADDAEQRGRREQAVDRWRQVAELDPDPTEAQARLAALAGPPDAATDPPAPAPRSEAAAEVLTGVSTTDPVGSAAPEPEPEAQEEPGETFVTASLAEIYLEQGFKGRALAIYRSILARNPDQAAVRRRVEALEEEMRRAQESGAAPAETRLDELEKDAPSGADRTDFQNFRRWIEGHRRGED